jgi:thiamine pyrophosphokinase
MPVPAHPPIASDLLRLRNSINTHSDKMRRLEERLVACLNEALNRIDRAIQILGGVGVTADHRVQRFFRDLRVERISGGTDEMMILTLAKGVLRSYQN